jgi:CheY-like chemotaxis protein
MARSAERHVVACHGCGADFDAMAAAWCACVDTTRTLICPSCSSCFCNAPRAYREEFWTRSPASLRTRRFQAERRVDPLRPNPPPSEVRRPMVLVVENEAAVQQAFRVILERMGCGVVCAADGEKGIELTKEYRPDLVLSDIVLPRMSGREMSQQLMGDPATAGTRVILVSGIPPSRAELQNLDQLGVLEYLAKPVRAAELRAVIAKHLDLARS